MNFRIILLTSLLAGLPVLCTNAQYTRVEEETILKSKIDNPVKVETQNQGDTYVFYAINRSFYPYQLKFQFKVLKNLTPEILNRSTYLLPGTNRLFSISVKDKNEPHHYEYQIQYRIGKPSDKVVRDYPYLIPFKTGKTFQLVSYANTYFTDQFKVHKGDTVVCLRKGYVVAVPDMFYDADRISARNSLEVMHSDGSTMIYENLDPDKVFARIGTMVYPGQPVGLIGNNEVLELYLYEITKEGMLKRLPINYCTSGAPPQTFTDKLATVNFTHPKEVIEREMTKREIKHYHK